MEHSDVEEDAAKIILVKSQRSSSSELSESPSNKCNESCHSRSRFLMNPRFIVAVLLVVAVPVCVQAQNPKVSMGDAQKVVTIISGDKAKTQAYCDMKKLSEQIDEASAKKDDKTVAELSQKIDTLEKILGPEYVALINRVPEIAENDQLRAEFLSAFGALARLCTR